jgi:hypothetical protein
MRRSLILGAALLLAACGDPRSEAAGELLRLHTELQAHAKRYGDFPRTLDPAQPATSANLPFQAGKGVAVRLNSVSAGRYNASARRKGWLCWSSAGRDEPVRPDCAPSGADVPGTPDTPPLSPVTPRAGG